MTITVKFVAKTPHNQDTRLWSSLLPEGGFEGVNFTFDIETRDYDWFVAYEGLPHLKGQSKVNRVETLACARANTLLITTEPSSIRLDGPHYLRQFGHVLTHKHPNLVRHEGQIRETPPLRWFYGRPMGGGDIYTSLQELSDLKFDKNEIISTVCSNKKMSHTVHSKRYEFVMALNERMADLDVFGRGIRPIDDKNEAMDDYKYHIAIENHIEAGHWTEKLSDCFLAMCLPFYFGDPNYATAFPTDAVIPIDIYDLDAAEAIIRSAIASNEYEKRRPALLEARQKTLKSYNVLGVVADIVRAKSHLEHHGQGDVIYGRHIFRQKHPFKAAQDAVFRARMARSPYASPLQV